jgi:hypothetical protein
VPITLGKDCAVSIGGNVIGVRSVSASATTRTVDLDEFGSRYVSVYPTGRDAVLSVEVNDTGSVGAMFAAIASGQELLVSGGAAGWSFTGVVTGISESTTVDGVATFTFEVRMTKSGLRTF